MGCKEILLVYDQQCPVCDNYCRLVQLKGTVGELRIVNAREASDVMDEITALGLDIDQGMVVKMHGKIYYGADAIHVLVLMSNRAGFFNRLNYRMLKSRQVAHIMYPVLKSGRNLMLKILHRTKINNLRRKNNQTF